MSKVSCLRDLAACAIFHIAGDLSTMALVGAAATRKPQRTSRISVETPHTFLKICSLIGGASDLIWVARNDLRPPRIRQKTHLVLHIEFLVLETDRCWHKTNGRRPKCFVVPRISFLVIRINCWCSRSNVWRSILPVVHYAQHSAIKINWQTLNMIAKNTVCGR